MTTSSLFREVGIDHREKKAEPLIDATVKIIDCQIGVWTQIGARTRMTETRLGDYSDVMEDCQVIYAEIGKFCSIASNIRINAPNHPTWRATSHHFTYRSQFYGFGEDDETIFRWRRDNKVVVGHDVWIGHGVIIVPGVRIGTGAVVGAGSVVTKDVPPYTIVAGNPARFLRRRVSENGEASLMKIQWWNWTHDQLIRSLDDFRRLDARGFSDKYVLCVIEEGSNGGRND
ncbi:MAG: chloramphenicol acetyltransferase [Thermodesulfobacteriota bacterium]